MTPLRVPHEWDAFAEPLEASGTTRFVTPEEARELFPPIHDAVRRERPGMTSRSDAWWEDRHLARRALLATDSRLFAGLADGQLWESRDRGDTWTPLRLEGDTVGALLALRASG
jgi:hypothetical protein